MKTGLLLILLITVNLYPAPEKRITWEPVAGAWGYRLEIKDAVNSIIVNAEITDNFYNVTKLEPGSYSFRIATINILKQTGGSTPWIDFVIEKLYVPELKSVSRRQLLSSYPNKNIIVKGNNFKPGAKLFLRGNGRETELPDLEIKSDSEAVFSFKPDSSMKGRYDLVIVNRGEAESVLKDSIEIVEPEKAENVFFIGAACSMNVPLGKWSDYYSFSYTGGEIFFQSSGRNLGLDNVIFELNLEAVRYNNSASFKKSSFTCAASGIGSGYYYPLPGNKFELFIKLNGGLVYSYLTMDENSAENSASSIDVFAIAGAGVRSRVYGDLFVDTSCSWKTIFYTRSFLNDIKISIGCGTGI